MQSKAPTVDAYMKSLTAEKRAVLAPIRAVMAKNIDKGYTEGMAYGLPGFFVPHSVYPDGYHCDPRQPLCFAGFAAQKNYFSLYMASVYCGCDSDSPELSSDAKWFREAWVKAGKKLDMGKVCIRFKRLEDVPLEVVGEAIRRVPVKRYIAMYEAALGPERIAKAHKAAEKLRAKVGGTTTNAKASPKPGTKTATKPIAKKKAAKKTSSVKGSKPAARAKATRK